MERCGAQFVGKGCIHKPGDKCGKGARRVIRFLSVVMPVCAYHLRATANELRRKRIEFTLSRAVDPKTE